MNTVNVFFDIQPNYRYAHFSNDYCLRWGVSEFEAATLSKLKEVELGIKPNTEAVPKKKKKKSGPNPLSCKKGKKKQDADQKQLHDSGVKKKKSRRGKKIPQHVKEELLKMRST